MCSRKALRRAADDAEAELHVRLMPITPESDREREAREAEDDDTPLHEMMREEMMRSRARASRPRRAL